LLEESFAVLVRVFVHSQKSEDGLEEDLAEVAFHDLEVGENDLFFFEVYWRQSEDLHQEHLKDFCQFPSVQFVPLDLRLDFAELRAQFGQFNLIIRRLVFVCFFFLLYFDLPIFHIFIRRILRIVVIIVIIFIAFTAVVILLVVGVRALALSAVGEEFVVDAEEFGFGFSEFSYLVGVIFLVVAQFVHSLQQGLRHALDETGLEFSLEVAQFFHH
jgi:hypothetical protein